MAKRIKTGGRKAGTPNKVTGLLKDAILTAAANVGHDGKGKRGLNGYLEKQAIESPGPFIALLGKVLPTQIGSDPDNPLKHVHRIERVIVDPENTDAEGVPPAT